MEQENNKFKDIPMPPLPEESLPEEETASEEVVTDQSVTEVAQEVNPDKVAEVAESSPDKAAVQETSAERNFAALRKEKERLELENAESLRRLAIYENAKVKQPEEDLEINIGDDDLFEGKHYRKLQKQLQKQQEALEKYSNQANLTATESKLKNKYTDFDKVVSEENIRKLRDTEPELAETISSTSDVYSKAVSAYKMIKKLGIYVEDNYEQDRVAAQRNSLKPKPLASVSPQQGESPLTKANAFANGLTPELKDQLWKEMNRSAEEY